MDRRSFLTLLGAAGVSVVIPKLWVPPQLVSLPGFDTKKLYRVSAPADMIFDIVICGKNEQSEVGTFDIVRPDGTKLLALALNTYGGIIRWVAVPGEELTGPLQFVYSASNMTINVVGKKNDVMSFTVIEPGHEIPVIIPAAPAWESALVGQDVPDVFKNAWNS